MTLTTRVLDYWFGPPGSPTYGERLDFWFEVSETVDDDVRKRFAEDLQRAADGAHDDMTGRSDSTLALTILLDQFPRNIYRGRPQAFAFDDKALSVARNALDSGFDQRVAPFQRMFLYLPFEHSEAMADQDRSVALFEALGDEVLLDFAVRHRDIIRRFGRFPHRNKILGRQSTPEEIAFLQQPGSSFGEKPDDKGKSA